MIAEALNVGLTRSAMLTLFLGLALHRRFMRAGETSPNRVIAATFALAHLQVTLAGLISRNPFTTPISAAALAAATWFWWNSGGGGGIRRAITKIKTRLASAGPVPQGA